MTEKEIELIQIEFHDKDPNFENLFDISHISNGIIKRGECQEISYLKQ